MENKLCVNGFSAVSEKEMMEVDGGGWFESLALGIGCGVIGSSAGPVGLVVGVGVGFLLGCLYN